METKCRCGCAHVHTASQEKERVPVTPQGKGKFRWAMLNRIWAPLSSCLFLIMGVIFQQQEWEWFARPAIQFGWFLLGFLPVGFPVMREAVEGIMQREWFNEFSLMTLASVGAFYIGEYPEALAVMLLYTLGEMLQDKAVGKATRDIRRLLDVRPEQVEVYQEGAFRTVSPREVKVGELIEVRSGERVPLDGTLQNPHAVFDTSALTGESMPRHMQQGDDVLAGMIAGGQAVRLLVTKLYEQSTLARILNLVQDATERKAPAELFIRRFARVYTPIVMILALLIVLLPAVVSVVHAGFDYVFEDWLYRGLVFLVISCPCALVISIPLGYFGGIGVASRMGILFKGSNYLDAITRVNTVVFDKTGTLTTGSFQVTSMQASGIQEEELLRLLISVEKKSTHPVAQAIVRYAAGRGAEPVEVTALSEQAGYGLEAEVEQHKLLVGNIRLLGERGVSVPDGLANSVSTVVACAVDGCYAGCLLLSDTLKEDSKDAVKALKALKIDNIQMLSGDKQEIVDTFAAELGIEKAYGDLLPEGKAAYMERLNSIPDASVAFVGDGMNDAPVLALSDVGIAMGGLGSDAAIESADVVIQTDQPLRVATAISIGRATRKIVMQNIVAAIGMKVLVLLAGTLGFATLWAAVFADVGVALLVVLNSVRILNKKF
ncbi:heavy metal translocating P-type ATPase [uncultured Bacteroides sp.]|uniref:heavy metal translocating P-type ATPase n=1 Tax=uncultured Bacteroides sp. TaxID=162156 RepID=UPI002601DE33|nr:heavy metal translocating P-type ATPase [uncultured Bacteroides sp.]